MRNYIIQTESGVWALVRHSSARVAERAWDNDPDAEPRVGPARPASKEEVRECVEDGHDYR